MLFMISTIPPALMAGGKMALAKQHHRQKLIQQAEQQTALQLLLSRGVPHVTY